MFSKIILIISFTGISYLAKQSNDIQFFYKKGLELINKKNYKKSNNQLLHALRMKKHPQIFFWLSYNYANLKMKDSCELYFSQILTTQPQPMTKFYLENMDKIKFWIIYHNNKEVKIDLVLKKRRGRNPIIKSKSPELDPELTKERINILHNNSLKLIKPEHNDSLHFD